MLLTAISDVAQEDSIDEEEEEEQILSLMMMETTGGHAGGAAALLRASSGENAKPGAGGKKGGGGAKQQLTVSQLGALDSASKERVLRFLLADTQHEAWQAGVVAPYAPRAPPPPPPPPATPATVIKVFGPEFPTARGRVGGSGNAALASIVPQFKPSYTQLYDDEPYNLSGAPKQGNPLYDDIQWRNTLTGNGTAYDRDARDVSHGPYEPDDGLTGQVLGSLAVPAAGSAGDGGWGLAAGVGSQRPGGVARAASPHTLARRAATAGYNGPEGTALGDDGLAWEAGRGGGQRPRGVPRYAERSSNRL